MLFSSNPLLIDLNAFSLFSNCNIILRIVRSMVRILCQTQRVYTSMVISESKQICLYKVYIQVTWQIKADKRWNGSKCCNINASYPATFARAHY